MKTLTRWFLRLQLWLLDADLAMLARQQLDIRDAQYDFADRRQRLLAELALMEGRP